MAKKYNLLDSVSDGYIVQQHHYDEASDSWIFEDIDPSLLQYDPGDTLPKFDLVMKDGYEYDEEMWSGIWSNGLQPTLQATDYYAYHNYGTPNQNVEGLPKLYISFGQISAKLPDELLKFDYVPELTVAVVHYTVQLDLLNCTADQQTVTTVNGGDNYTVNFTSNDGYEFSEPPYVVIGSETINADITDSTHATLTITNINENLTIVAHATEPEPVKPKTELAFVNIYNPTQEQLVDAANSLFMHFDTGQIINTSQYIVALHKVFVPVSTDEAFQPIKFGNYNTQVNSKVVNQRLARVSCGKVTIPEVHHNALDYSPYTTVRIWLPFLGFFDLSIDE